MQQSHRPRIAIFDSGIGGLTVAAAVRARLPGADLRYLGDTARLPYGTKSVETVTRYALAAARVLLSDGDADALVVACNTVSACALPALSELVDIPVLGVIDPGARRAVATTERDCIGVIGTERTIASDAYRTAITALSAHVSVHGRATPLMVGLAEEGFFEGPLVDAALDAYLSDWLIAPNVATLDTLVLGCTHYPVFKPAIAAFLRDRLGHDVALIDSADAIADELSERFPEAAVGSGDVELLATDSLDRFGRVGGRFFPMGRAVLRLIDL
jgi:glutamate racemase